MKELFFKNEFVRLVPDIPGDFKHAATLDFDKIMHGKYFWVFNETNRDLYYSFYSSKFDTKKCGHYLDGQCDEQSGYITWFPLYGMYVSQEGGNRQYFRPIGWHDGIYLMENCEYGGVEVLVTPEKEALYRADSQKVYAAIEIIRQANERASKEPLLLAKDKKSFWLKCLIAELICLILMVIPVVLQSVALVVFTVAGGIAAVAFFPIYFSRKYAQMKWLALGRYFDGRE